MEEVDKHYSHLFRNENEIRVFHADSKSSQLQEANSSHPLSAFGMEYSSVGFVFPSSALDSRSQTTSSWKAFSQFVRFTNAPARTEKKTSKQTINEVKTFRFIWFNIDTRCSVWFFHGNVLSKFNCVWCDFPFVCFGAMPSTQPKPHFQAWTLFLCQYWVHSSECPFLCWLGFTSPHWCEWLVRLV